MTAVRIGDGLGNPQAIVASPDHAVIGAVNRRRVNRYSLECRLGRPPKALTSGLNHRAVAHRGKCVVVCTVFITVAARRHCPNYL